MENTIKTTNAATNTTETNINPGNFIDRVWHEIQTLFGREEKIELVSSGTPTIVKCEATSKGFKETVVEGERPKNTVLFKKKEKVEKVVACKVPFGLWLGRTFKITFWLEIALLALRHFCPEVAEAMPHAYLFLDTVAVPVFDWVCALLLNAVEWLASLPFFAKLLELAQNVG